MTSAVQTILNCLFVFIFTLSTANAITMNQFVTLNSDQQMFYIAGVLDLEAIDASYDIERGDCINEWGVEGAYTYLVEWYGQHEADNALNEMNVALILLLQIPNVCSYPVIR